MITPTHCNLVNTGLFVSTSGDIGNCCMQTNRVPLDWEVGEDIKDWYAENIHFQKIRNDLNVDSEKNDACKSCWKKESLGLTSKRWAANKDSIENNTELQHLDFRLSNKCNLQCKMCSPSDSSQLEKLAYEMDNPTLKKFSKNKLKYMDNISEFLNSFIEIKTLKSIRFAGGEPFIMEEVEEFLAKMIEHNMVDVEIEFITNCTSAKTRILSMLDKFKNVTLGCSIDGVGEVLEYQRYPAKWENIEKNFIKFYNTKIEISLTPCVSFLTYLSLDSFFEWANKFPKANVVYNEVDKKFMDFRLIPLDDRTPFINNFKNMKFYNAQSDWMLFQKEKMYEYKKISDSDKAMLLNYIEIWDYKSKKKFLDVYPWAEKILNE